MWAVGSTALGNAVSMHWNGGSWTEVLTADGDHPDSPPSDFNAVFAVSAGDIWAVGVNSGESVAERWNGTAWTQLDPVIAGGSVFLNGVSAVSATTSGRSGQPAAAEA